MLTVLICRDNNPIDATLASTMVDLNKCIILLTKTDFIPTVTKNELLRLLKFNITNIVIVGGYNAVSVNVERELKNILGLDFILRIGGGDRIKTAVLISQYITNNLSNTDISEIHHTVKNISRSIPIQAIPRSNNLNRSKNRTIRRKRYRKHIGISRAV